MVQRKRNFHLNHIAKAIRAIHPSLEVSPHRASATLVVAWQEIVQVVYDDASQGVQLQWQPEAIKSAGIDLAGIEAEYHRTISAAGPLRGQSRG